MALFVVNICVCTVKPISWIVNDRFKSISISVLVSAIHIYYISSIGIGLYQLFTISVEHSKISPGVAEGFSYMVYLYIAHMALVCMQANLLAIY